MIESISAKTFSGTLMVTGTRRESTGLFMGPRLVMSASE
jgi:hypothetical protein